MGQQGMEQQGMDEQGMAQQGMDPQGIEAEGREGAGSEERRGYRLVVRFSRNGAATAQRRRMTTCVHRSARARVLVVIRVGRLLRSARVEARRAGVAAVSLEARDLEAVAVLLRRAQRDPASPITCVPRDALRIIVDEFIRAEVARLEVLYAERLAAGATSYRG